MEILIPIIAIIAIFLIPITGVMLILVSRFALKPMVETLAAALKDSRHGDTIEAVHLQALMDQVEELSAEVGRLRTAQEFDRQLMASSAEPDDGGP